MGELKPCPFCGENATVVREDGCCGRPDNLIVRCSNGGCGTEGWYWNDGDAEGEAWSSEAWNHRPGEDAERERAAGMVEEMRDEWAWNPSPLYKKLTEIIAKIRAGE